MFTSIIRTIIGIKFQIDPLTVTRFSGSGPTSPPPPPCLAKSQNAVGYTVKIPADPQATVWNWGSDFWLIYSCYKARSISSPHLIFISGTSWYEKVHLKTQCDKGMFMLQWLNKRHFLIFPIRCTLGDPVLPEIRYDSTLLPQQKLWMTQFW